MRSFRHKVPLAFLTLLSLPSEAIPAWRRGGPDGGMVRAIVIDPARSSTLYAATDGSGVFKTTTGGEAWEAASEGLPSDQMFDLAADPFAAGTLWAATGSGLARTVDGGQTWSAVSLPADTSGGPVHATEGPGAGEAVEAVAVEPGRADTVYAMLAKR
jgi:photosystem II stability/assembly factor-like uncharacterized protein